MERAKGLRRAEEHHGWARETYTRNSGSEEEEILRRKIEQSKQLIERRSPSTEKKGG